MKQEARELNAEFEAKKILGGKATEEQIKTVVALLGEVSSAQKDVSERKQGIALAEGAIKQGKSPIERLEEEQAQLLILKEKYVDQSALFDEALTANSKKQADLRSSYQIANANLILSASSNLFGGLASLLKTSGNEQSNAYKAMFALSKGFAVAQAAMNLSLAISNASAITPWYASLPAVASVVSAGAGLASSIAGATYGGRENGGSVIGGQTYEVGEKNKPEMLMIPGNNGKVFSNAEMKSAMGGSGNGGGGAPIINNYAAGSGVSVSHRRDELTKRDVFDIVQNEMSDSNSKGRRGMQRNSNVTGVLNGGRRA
jgi:SLT domain-containing protein